MRGLLDEFGLTDETAEETPADQEVGGAEPSQEDLGDLGPEIEAAEARWREVSYYRSLTGATMFDEVDDPIVKRVNARIREFAKREIASIVGGRPPEAAATSWSKDGEKRLSALAGLSDAQIRTLVKVAGTLTDDQVGVLSAVAERIIANPAIIRSLLGPTLAKPKPVAPTAPARATAPPRAPAPVARPRPMIAPGTAARRPGPPARGGVRRTPGPAATAPETKERRRTPTTEYSSPHSAPIPRGEDFSASTQALADGAVQAGKKKMVQDIKEGPRE